MDCGGCDFAVLGKDWEGKLMTHKAEYEMSATHPENADLTGDVRAFADVIRKLAKHYGLTEHPNTTDEDISFTHPDKEVEREFMTVVRIAFGLEPAESLTGETK